MNLFRNWCRHYQTCSHFNRSSTCCLNDDEALGYCGYRLDLMTEREGRRFGLF